MSERRSILLVLGFLALAMGAFAQGNVLVIGPVVKAGTLTGTVRDSNGDGIAGVSVIRFECGSGAFRGVLSPQALENTHSDASGRFQLSWPKQGRTCLEFQSLGVDLLEFEVKRSRGSGELHPKLTVGT